jgi:hypothetical protein
MPKPEKLPLSPMLVQYLVGLCTLKWGAAASINAVLGDMVYDEGTDSHRDVDVTVTLNTPDGVYAFMGYEVRHYNKPLDATHVEQLAGKLNDMPSVTHRAIVSTSGYYKPAIKKAEHHGIDLYVIKEWTTPLEEQFPDLAPITGAPEEVFRGVQFLLTWQEPRIWVITAGPQINLEANTPLFDAQGNPHQLYSVFDSFARDMYVRSTDMLWPIPPISDRAAPLRRAHFSHEPLPEEPQWPYGHTLDVFRDEVYVRSADGGSHRFDQVTIEGDLRWKGSKYLYCAMEKVPTGEMFSGAMVATSPIPGRMWAIIVPTQGRTLEFRNVRLTREQLNMLRNLEIAVAPDNSTDTA